MNTAPERHPDVAWLEMEGEVVIYDPRTSLSFVLNPLAGLLWQLLDGQHSLDEQFADLAEASAQDVDELRTSFDPVVDHWRQHDLIVETT